MIENTATGPCPACGATHGTIFYEAEHVPIHSVLLMETREQALSYPKGTIRLSFCESCGFITNAAFDPTLHEYSSRYEETQSFSPTFNEFHRALAQRLVEKYDLHDKDIIEIGCGKGDFLHLLCTLGNNRGIGVDPAYVPDRNPGNDRVRFITDLYSEKYAYLQGDFIVCKMTLEHIQPVNEFVRMIRRSIGTKTAATIFIQIPNVTYILRDVAFWDIYYEHCSYFSRGSLARLFRRCGFEVLTLSTEYSDQYLTLTARPAVEVSSARQPEENDMPELRRLVHHFVASYPERLRRWKERFMKLVDEGKRIVLWGAGSKGVAFLTALNITHEVMPYAVDINPYKHGTFLAGSGQEIVPPAFLVDHQPDTIIIMNPVYEPEIRRMLSGLGVAGEVITL